MLRDAEKVFQFEKLKCTVTCVCLKQKKNKIKRLKIETEKMENL